MPFYTLEYVYQISDFDTTGGNIAPPNESGALAAGVPPFNITLDAGASAQQIDLEDTDNGLDEINNAGQVLTSAITLDGVLYPVGTTILVNYRITDDNGFNGYSITLGAANSGGNTTTAFVTDAPMVPGQQYIFTAESNIGQGEVLYTELACFTAGSLVLLENGTKDVACVQQGDMVKTANGPRSVLWVGRRTVAAIGDMAPIRFEAGTLGNHDMIEVSPNHRMLVTGAWAELYFGQDEILMAAKHLVNGHNITQQPRGFVTYVHLMFDHHALVTVNGCVSESYFLSADNTKNCPQALEIKSLFPEMNITAMRLAVGEARCHEGALLGTVL